MLDPGSQHPSDLDDDEAAGLPTHGGLRDNDPWSTPEPTPEAPAAEVTGGAVPPARRNSAFGMGAMAEVLEVVALALIMFVAVRSVAQNFVVDGGSMNPNLSDGQLLIVNKLVYRSFDLSWLPGVDNEDWRPFGDPQVGDVVVFRFPQNPERDFIKRVIALPGQTVEVINDELLIDGARVDEPYVDEPPGYRFGPETVLEGQLFVLGDNRNNSYDSHSWGMLDRDLIIGRADLSYWPISEAGTITHFRTGLLAQEVTSSP